MTDAELAKVIMLACIQDERWGKPLLQDPTRGTDRRPVGYFWAEVAAKAARAAMIAEEGQRS